MKILLIHTHSCVVKLHPAGLSSWGCWLGSWLAKVSKVRFEWRSEVTSKSCRLLFRNLDLLYVGLRLGSNRLSVWLLLLKLRLSVHWLLTWWPLLCVELRLALNLALTPILEEIWRLLHYFLSSLLNLLTQHLRSPIFILNLTLLRLYSLMQLLVVIIKFV